MEQSYKSLVINVKNMAKFDAINEKLPLFLFMFHARSLFVTVFEWHVKRCRRCGHISF